MPSETVVLGFEAGKRMMELLCAAPVNQMYLYRSAERCPLYEIALLLWNKLARTFYLTEPCDLLELPQRKGVTGRERILAALDKCRKKQIKLSSYTDDVRVL